MDWTLRITTFLILGFVATEASDPKQPPSRANFGPVVIRVGCQEPTSLYLESDFPEVYREASVYAAFENTGEESVSLTCRARILDYKGRERSVRPPGSPLELKPGERKKLSFATDPSRGVFYFYLTVSGSGALQHLGEITVGKSFAVVPPPSGDTDPCCFFQLQGLNAHLPFTGELCRRGGFKVIKEQVGPDITAESFCYRMKKAKGMTLTLKPILPLSLFSESGMFADKLEQISARLPFWKECCFRLDIKSFQHEALQRASAHVLQGFSVEGDLRSLAYMLKLKRGGASAACVSTRKQCKKGEVAAGSQIYYKKLKALVFRPPANLCSYPHCVPYAYRYLDQCRRLAEEYGLEAELGAFFPEAKDGAERKALAVFYTLASALGFKAVCLEGPRVLRSEDGRFRVDLLQTNAALSYFLHDLEPVKELWPCNTGLFGCVFADPREKDPQGNPGKQSNPSRKTKVALLFAFPFGGERVGKLYLKPAGDLAAYDIAGNPTGQRTEDGLSVPFGPEPVVITTRKLGIDQFVSVIQAGKIQGLDLFTIKALPFSDARSVIPPLKVLVDNSDTRAVVGSLEVRSADGSDLLGSGQFEAKPGQVTTVTVPLTRLFRRSSGIYSFKLVVTTDRGRWTEQIQVPTCVIFRLSGQCDSDFSEWENVPAVPFGDAKSAGGALSSGFLRLGFDDHNLRVAVEVKEKKHGSRWNGKTDPHSLREAFEGSLLEVALGFGPPAWKRRSGKNCSLKAALSDTDYLFLLAPDSKGKANALILHEPEMTWGECFLRGARREKGVKGAICRKGDLTLYELSIPLKALQGFSPEAKGLRLSVVVSSFGQILEFSPYAGVPRYFASPASFLWPQERAFTANQVWWGIAR